MPEQYLKKSTFQCDRTCGECCITPTVLLTPQDLKRIKTLGHRNFYQKAPFERGFELKKTKRGCIFLEKNNEIYSCKIYKDRPEVCKKYPFIGIKMTSCKPSEWTPTFKKGAEFSKGKWQNLNS